MIKTAASPPPKRPIHIRNGQHHLAPHTSTLFDHLKLPVTVSEGRQGGRVGEGKFLEMVSMHHIHTVCAAGRLSRRPRCKPKRKHKKSRCKYQKFLLMVTSSQSSRFFFNKNLLLVESALQFSRFLSSTTSSTLPPCSSPSVLHSRLPEA